MTEITYEQKLEWQNKALRDALEYLLETKRRKETIGKDAIYLQRKNLGWMKAEQLINSPIPEKGDK